MKTAVNSLKVKASKKVAVALSGGVDSGVAAALLVKAGYQVAGFHLHFWAEKIAKNINFDNKCCSTESLEAARKTASLFKIPFYTLNFEKLFKKKIVDYFLREFSLGRTPNPCVMCNKFVKFGKLLDYVLGLGFDFLATGHYSRIATKFKIQNSKFKITSKKSKTYHLLQGRDRRKDQSYFLYNLTQKQLARVLFPVGDYTKEEVRGMAKRWKLPVAHRPESQEICFFPETDYRPFLKRQIPTKIKTGDVVDTQGNVIGEHDGLPLYTIGQRHGFKISSKFPSARAQGEGKVQSSKLILPLYVVGVDIKKNRLIVGWGKEAERKGFEVEKVHWINPRSLRCLARGPAKRTLRAQVRIRHLGELYPCQLITHNCHQLDKPKTQYNLKLITVILDEPTRAITPGQSAVFYQDKEVLGGGVIV